MKGKNKMYKISRKECLKDIGKKEYGFDIEREEIIYLYHCGMKLSRKQWKKLDEIEKDGGCSYKKWEQYIKQKYLTENNEEFKGFLRQFLVVQENFLETGQIICAALLGALFATFASVGQEIMSGIDDLSICNFILSLVVQFVIIVLFFAICSFYVIRTVNNITFLEKARKNMCKDILEILKK